MRLNVFREHSNVVSSLFVQKFSTDFFLRPDSLHFETFVQFKILEAKLYVI